MTESQIERRVEKMVDQLDAEYLSSSISADRYQLRMKQIDDWAWMQRYSARLERTGG